MRNGSSSRSRADRAGGTDDNDPAAALRVRARRRLIGAAALLLAAVIIVPLLLDRTPRPAPDNIPIEIPSEKAPFTPRLSLPPVPDPGQTPVAPPPDVGPPDAEKPKAEPAPPKSEAPSEPAKPARPSIESKPPAKEAPPKKSEKKAKAAALPEAKATEAVARTKAGKILLQAAALGTDAAAHELSERLRKSGFTPYTEKIDTADGVRYRVRVGPYTTRDEAQRAQSRLRTLGISATLVNT